MSPGHPRRILCDTCLAAACVQAGPFERPAPAQSGIQDMAEPSAGGDAVSDSVRSVVGVGDKTAAYLLKFAIETVNVVA